MYVCDKLREMSLDDGRFLMHPDRYDDLTKKAATTTTATTTTATTLHKEKKKKIKKNTNTQVIEAANKTMLSPTMIRVDPGFCVIALGIPTPPCPGHPLDPPFRSRFQGLRPVPVSPEDVLRYLKTTPLLFFVFFFFFSLLRNNLVS